MAPGGTEKRAKGGGAAKRRGLARRFVIAVSDDQRQCLIEDIAYFRAEHFRRVEPGQCREEDRTAAKAEIETVLRRFKTTRGS